MRRREKKAMRHPKSPTPSPPLPPPIKDKSRRKRVESPPPSDISSEVPVPKKKRKVMTAIDIAERFEASNVKVKRLTVSHSDIRYIIVAADI